MPKFLYATYDDVASGATSDIYFFRTLKILREKGLCNAYVYAEVTASGFPRDYRWAVFAGLRDSLELFRGKRVNVYSLPEGTVFPERDYYGVKVPVMAIEGEYCEFAVYETPLLGFLSTATGIATKAARVKLAAGDTLVLSFGARRTHPAVSPFNAFYAYIGGCDGVSCILGAKLLGIKPMGTMPHSLMIIFRALKGDHTEAWKAFDEVVEEEVPRVVLADTFWDEAEESIRAAQLLGDRLWGVRLDTPSSRRGNLADIVREVKWKLRAMGYDRVRIVVSGGINEYVIAQLKEAGVDAFGVGAAIANAPIVDFALDITAVKIGERYKPISKRGKYAGVKQLYRCQRCLVDVVRLKDEEPPRCPKCGGEMVPMLKQYIKNGELVEQLPPPGDVRKRVLEQLRRLKLDKLPWEVE